MFKRQSLNRAKIMMTDFEGDLHPYAARSTLSRRRHFAESASDTRSEFQRDRDRIIHCTAFRRLEYKTQVFVNHEGDLFRTRLTHSIEVAQIARSLARNLQLNEDLVEAISLAHDLGHTPFGHAGQDALNACMKMYGGFEHNLQSLRVIDKLEQRYGAFDGLNLMFETREGVLIGTIANVRNFGAGDILDVGHEIGENLLLPFTEKVVPIVEITNKRFIVDMPEEVIVREDEADDA